MRGRIAAVLRLLAPVIAVALLVGLAPLGGQADRPKQRDRDPAAAAVQERPDGDPGIAAIQRIMVCKERGRKAPLRPVAAADECTRKERAADLNDSLNPVGVCVRDSDQLLKMVRARKNGSRPDDCNRRSETRLLLPADTPTDLCLRPDGFLRLCDPGDTPDVIVPVRNRPPDAVDDTGAGFTTDEASSFTTGNILANDVDLDGDALTIVQVRTDDARGQVTDNGDGTLDYDPNGRFEDLAVGESATDSFDYTIEDELGQRDTATIAITVDGVNDPPTAADDAATTNENAAVTVNVRANDSDPDASDTLTVGAVDTTGTLGQVTNNGTNVDYDPNGQFASLPPGGSATDTFSYTIDDGHGGTDTATVTVTINGRNNDPVATDDAGAGFATDEDTPFTTGDVLANDSDGDGGTLEVTDLDLTGTRGAVTDNGDGTFAYDPDGQFEDLGAGENATDTFAYTVADGQGGIDTANVAIAVAGVNDVPNARDDDGAGFATDAASPFTTGNVLANDTDADGDPLSVASIDLTGTQGNVTDNGDGTFGYDPNGQFDDLAGGESATDTFTYTAADGNGGTDTATVTIAIQGVNEDPTAVDDAGAGFATDEDTAFTTASLLANDSDPDTADTLSVTNIDRGATAGQVQNNGDGTVDYDPNGQFESLAVGESDTDTFGYTAADGNGSTDTATVTITIAGVNDGPTATNDTATTGEGTSVTIDLLANDADPDTTDTLSVTNIDRTGTLGQVTNNGDGTVGYDPNGQFDALEDGETATDTFAYTISDGHGGTDTASVTVTINGLTNLSPIAVDDSGAGFGTDEDTPFTTGNVLTNDSDPDTDPLEVDGLDDSATAGLVTDNGDGTVGYDPNGQFDALPAGGSDTDTFDYTLADGRGGTDVGTVTIAITGVNDAPVLANIEGGAVAYDEGDGPTAITSSVTVADVDGATIAGATVTISANYQNGADLLAFANTPAITGTFNPASGTLTLAGSASEADYQAALRVVTYENTSDDPGGAARTISFRVDDGAAANNLSNIATRDVTIAGVNDAPVLANIEGGALAYAEGAGPVAITGAITVADIDSANLAGATVQLTGNYQNGQDLLAFTNTASITGSFNAGNGTLTLTGSASPADYQAALRAVTYQNNSDTPSPATRTVTFRVDDGAAANNLSNAATRDVAVTAVNDAPALANAEGAALAVTEGDAATAVTATLTVADADSANLSSATVTITAGYQNGADLLAFANTPSITGNFNPATATLTLTGSASPADYQAALRAVTYQNTSQNPTVAARTLSFQVNDGAAANNLSNIATRTISVTAVNDPPVNTVPGNQTVNEDTNLVFNSGNGNPIAIADADAGGGTVKLSLDVLRGTLDLPSTAGLTFVDGTADNTASIHVTGTIAAINAALNGLTYRGALHHNDSRGAESLTVVANDQGNTGGAAQSDTDTVAIAVTAVNDAPTAAARNFGADSVETNMQRSIDVANGLFNGAADPDTGDGGYTVDFAVGTVNGVAPSSGTITATIAGVGTVVADAASGAFTFDPAPGVTGTVSFPFTVCDSGNPGSQCSGAVNATFNISGPVTWFVDPAAGTNGVGTLASPFNTLAAADAVDAANHRIFVFSGTAASGIALQTGGWLVGQGVTGFADYDTLMSIAVPNGTITRPTLGGGAATLQNTLTLNANAVVKGIALATTTNPGLTDPAGATAGVDVVQTTVTTTTGTAILFDNLAGTLTLPSVSASGAATGISLTGVSATITIAGGTIQNTTTRGVFVDGGAPAFSFAGTVDNAAGRSVQVEDLTGGAVTFSGTIDDDGTGILVQNNTPTSGSSTVTFSGGIKLLTTGANAAVTLDNNDNATITFSGGGLDIDTTGGAGFTALNGLASLTVSGGTNTIDSTTGTALSLNGVAAGSLGLASVSANGAATGIGLTNVGASVTISGGSILNTTTVGVLIDGSNGAFSFPGTVDNGAGRSVQVVNRTGGTVTFSGTIDDDGTGILVQNNTSGSSTITFSAASKILTTGANAAVTLNNNDNATITLSGGGLDIDTTSGAGFSATNGAAAITVTGSGNSIASTTGTALNVSGSTIGGSGLIFHSISSNGGSNTGIILDSTGAGGGLTVTGGGTAGSGGTVANKTGADGSTATGIGIYLNNTRNISLSWMQLNDFQNFAIRGANVVGFTLNNSVINGTNGNNDGQDEGSVMFTELTGSANVSNSNISGSVEHNFAVINTGGTLNRLTVTATTFGPMSTTSGSDGLLVEGQNNAIVNVTVQNCFFTFAIGDHFQLNLLGALTGVTSGDLVFTGNTISNTGVTAVSGGGGIRLTGGSDTNPAGPLHAAATFNISNNTIRDSRGTAIAANKLGGSGTYSGTIANNNVGVSGAGGSGSLEGSGIFVLTAGGGTYSASITGNTVRQYDNFGIFTQTGGSGVVGSAALNLTVTGNTVTEPEPVAPGVLATNGFHLNGGVTPGDAYQVCLDLSGNTLAGSGQDSSPPGSGIDQDFRLRQRQSTTVRLPGYTGTATDVAAVVTFLQAQNPGSETGLASTNSPPGGGFTNTSPAGSACAQPTAGLGGATFFASGQSFGGGVLAAAVDPFDSSSEVDSSMFFSARPLANGRFRVAAVRFAACEASLSNQTGRSLAEKVDYFASGDRPRKTVLADDQPIEVRRQALPSRPAIRSG